MVIQEIMFNLEIIQNTDITLYDCIYYVDTYTKEEVCETQMTYQVAR